MNRRNKRQKGFTLIELLVVLIIIAVLAAVLVPALTRYVDDAREKKAVSEAQVCVTAATEWAAKQRTALISQAYQSNAAFKDAYINPDNAALLWSHSYEDLTATAPTVTGGTLALAEGDGQYFLRPNSTPNGTTDDDMKNTVKTAAGVDGALQQMQLNADGKVLYLLYTSAEGITVAYTAAGTAQTPTTTVPVATLPENTTPPKPPKPDHSGDLVFCVLDEYTGKPVEGISFHVEDFNGNRVFDSQSTDEKGMVYYPLEPAKLSYNNEFKLIPDSWPEGYQQVLDVQFRIIASDSDGDNSYDSYKIEEINNVNHSTNRYNYKIASIGKLQDGAENHLYTFYVRSVPTLELCVWDDVNNKHVEGVEFTLSNGTKSTTVTSGSVPKELDVKLHEKDNLRPGRDDDVIDFTGDSFSSVWKVSFTKVPEGYQYFDNCNIKILLENQFGYNAQLYTEFQKDQVVDDKKSRTDITYDNQYYNNKCIVTIHVKGGKTVNFYVYDGLDSEHPTQLPNAKMELRNEKNETIATFTTDENGAGNFTETLLEGNYTLKLTNGRPDGYPQPADIHFKVERGEDGLLTLTGTGDSTSCVDNASSSVTMLVTKPNTKRFYLQVVDATTKDPWAGVNVKLTGKGLTSAMTEEMRYYAINSLAENKHSFDVDTTKSDDITVTIVGSDNQKEFKPGHNNSYINNFVGSKYVFNLSKNKDGTFKLTAKESGNERFNGEIDGTTVKVYAYPRLLVDFDHKGSLPAHIALIKATLQIYTPKDEVATTKDGKTIEEWKINTDAHNTEVGLSMGTYQLRERREIGPMFKCLNLPLDFKIGQDENGFPKLTDTNGNLGNSEYYVNTPPLKITAWYESILSS